MSYCVNVNICLPSRSVAFGEIVTPIDQNVQTNVSRILGNLHMLHRLWKGQDGFVLFMKEASNFSLQR
jgi:hypothetical protein